MNFALSSPLTNLFLSAGQQSLEVAFVPHVEPNAELVSRVGLLRYQPQQQLRASFIESCVDGLAAIRAFNAARRDIAQALAKLRGDL